MKTKILAPESALGAKHFKSCVILGHPRNDVRKKILFLQIFSYQIESFTHMVMTENQV